MTPTIAPRLLAFILPLLAATGLQALMPAPTTVANAHTALLAVTASASGELETIFAELDYQWPPQNGAALPPLAVQALPQDFDTLDVQQRKQLFFRILAPLVAAENNKLREQREFLLHTFEQFEQLPKQSPVFRRVQAIAQRFDVSGDLNDGQTRETLLRRVDIVPAALVLAQAANESGWGTSRFAREANNLFGMWTWDENEGIEPARRAANARHFVRSFGNLREAIGNYLHTINVGRAYRELRTIRAAQRARGEPPSAIEMAAGLERYSARGKAYVSEIRSIIRFNQLDELPPLRIEISPVPGH